MKEAQFRPRPPLWLDLMAAALCAALSPFHAEALRAAFLGGIFLCVLFPSPPLRYLLFAASSFFLFRDDRCGAYYAVALAWILLPTYAWPRRMTGTALWVFLGLVLGATVLGALSLFFFDHLAPPVGRIFLLPLQDYYSRAHLAAVGALAMATVLLGCYFFQVCGFGPGKSVLTYTELYCACRRQLNRLGRKWQC